MAARDRAVTRLRILGKSTSINVRKVLWLCAELQLAYDHEEWGSGCRPTGTAGFLAMNPNGLVPVLQDGAFVLWESNTICRYLAAREGRSDLLPQQAQPRAQVEQWMDWQATELNNAWRYAFMALVRGSAAHTDADLITASIASWNRHMQILDAQLERTDAFAVGQTFTLADVVLGLSAHRWITTPMQRPLLSSVQSYYERLSQRPGFLLHGRNGVP
jgi:glutathione S-transferase